LGLRDFSVIASATAPELQFRSSRLVRAVAQMGAAWRKILPPFGSDSGLPIAKT
jgi:hypothetical protein